MSGNFSIPSSVTFKELETNVLSILEKFTPPANAGLLEDCQSLPSKENLKKVILKLNGPTDAKKVQLKEKN